MTYATLIVEALSGMKIREVDTPLHNTFIIDEKWVLELDRDGGFATYISSTDNSVRSFSEGHKLIVFSEPRDVEETKEEIRVKIVEAIEAFSK